MLRQISSSDIRRSVGQLLIIGFDGSKMSPGLATLLTRLQPAGVILFDRNVTGRTPSAAEVFATGDRKLFRKHGKVIGDSCRTLGFNTDFAPVVDLAFEASKTVMSSRAVSANPKEAVVYAR